MFSQTIFKDLGESYNAARKDYPAKVIDYVIQEMAGGASVLDVGCGTGIATRQLASRFNSVHGADSEETMVAEAEKSNVRNIKYLVAPAHELPFPAGSFDLVTAFSAFHWFADKQSVQEIKRVMKKRGRFAAVNKYDSGDFRNIYEEIVRNFGGAPQDVRDDYAPQKILRTNEFRNIEERKFRVTDHFTQEQLRLQAKSMSLYHLISEERKEEALNLLLQRLHFNREGLFARPIRATVVRADK